MRSQLSLIGVIAFATVATTGSVVAAPGDLYVADTFGLLIRVDPVSGDRTIVSSSDLSIGAGPAFGTILDMIRAPDGDLLVAHNVGSTGTPSDEHQILRVDPQTGDRSVLSSAAIGNGPSLDDPLGNFLGMYLALRPNGALLAVRPESFLTPVLLEVDLESGDRRLLAMTSGDPCGVRKRGIAERPLGHVVLGCLESAQTIASVDLQTGVLALVPASFSDPGDLLIEQSGTVLVSALGSNGSALFRADLSGATEQVAPGEFTGLVASPDGSTLWASDFDRVSRIELATGTVQTISSDSIGTGPLLQGAIAIAREPDPAQVPALAGLWYAVGAAALAATALLARRQPSP